MLCEVVLLLIQVSVPEHTLNWLILLQCEIIYAPLTVGSTVESRRVGMVWLWITHTPYETPPICQSITILVVFCMAAPHWQAIPSRFYGREVVTFTSNPSSHARYLVRESLGHIE